MGEVVGGASRVWQIPYAGRAATLGLTQSVFGKTVLATLDGTEIARWATPTGDRPWAEYPLNDSDTEHGVVVALISAPDEPFMMRVFVDGHDLDDGASLESWRSRPRPRDRFERAFSGWWFFDWYGLVAFGLAVASPIFLGAIAAQSPVLAVASLVVAGLGSAYWFGITRLVRWLIGKTGWPVTLRTAIVWFALFGSLAAVLLLLQWLSSPR